MTVKYLDMNLQSYLHNCFDGNKMPWRNKRPVDLRLWISYKEALPLNIEKRNCLQTVYVLSAKYAQVKRGRKFAVMLNLRDKSLSIW